MKQQLENYLYSEIDSMFSQRVDLGVEEVEEIYFSKMKIINKELSYKENNEYKISKFIDTKTKILAECEELEKMITIINKSLDSAKEILNELEVEEDYREIEILNFDQLEEAVSVLDYITDGVERHKTEYCIFTGNGATEAQVDYDGADGNSYIMDISINFKYELKELKNKDVEIIELEITNYTIK